MDLILLTADIHSHNIRAPEVSANPVYGIHAHKSLSGDTTVYVIQPALTIAITYLYIPAECQKIVHM